MKNFLILSFLSILFYGCGDNGVGFDMSYRQDFEIPAGLNTFDTHVFELRNIPTNKDAFLNANSVTEANITDITPREARLSLNFGEEDFYFIREIVIEIFTQDNITGKEIFFRENVPLNTGRRIDIIPSLPQVTEILTGDRFSVRVEMLFRDISPTFIDARLEMIFLAKIE